MHGNLRFPQYQIKYSPNEQRIHDEDLSIRVLEVRFSLYLVEILF